MGERGGEEMNLQLYNDNVINGC